MKKVIIVGAGIAGLTAGIYARQSGFEVTIYESHTIPGGASTSWRRKGYLFEGGMHWLTGSSPKSPINRLWREVGALDDEVVITERDPFFVFEAEGKTACLYRDARKLREHLCEVAPEDSDEIVRFCRDIERFAALQMPVTDIKGVKTRYRAPKSPSFIFKVVPVLPRMAFYSKLTSREYASRFHCPALRLMLENIVGPELSATALIFTLATLASGDGGYPEGGSLGMAKRMARRFESLGGVIRYGALVERVETENGVARGIIVDGALIPADAVIVTQDTRCAIDDLFATPIEDGWAQSMRASTVPMIDTFLAFGVEADLSDMPETFMFSIDEPLSCGGIPVTVAGFNNYACYAGYAPEGCTALTAFFMGDSYDFWKRCREQGTYEDEKRKLAESYIDILTRKIPRLAGKVTVWDVATPLTYERYLHSFKGSWMSEMVVGDKIRSYPSQPEGIESVYFASQRLMKPGGLPVALETGRKAVQCLCRDTGTVFQGNL